VDPSAVAAATGYNSSRWWRGWQAFSMPRIQTINFKEKDSKIVNSPDLKLKVQVQVVTLGNFALGQPPKTMRIGS
jgi:hypothetical protein